MATHVRSPRGPQLGQVGPLALLFSLAFALLCCPVALGRPAGTPAGAAAGAAAADQGVWPLLLVPFVSYALLPVRSLLAGGFGLAVAASHLLITATLAPAKRPRLWRTVSARGAPSPPAQLPGGTRDAARGVRGSGGPGGGGAARGHPRRGRGGAAGLSAALGTCGLGTRDRAAGT